MQPQYITDENGKRVSVILPIQDYEELLEDLTDLAAIAEQRNEKTILGDQVKKELVDDGLLPD